MKRVSRREWVSAAIFFLLCIGWFVGFAEDGSAIFLVAGVLSALLVVNTVVRAQRAKRLR
jgi:di/tricarboxylate transporter